MHFSSVLLPLPLRPTMPKNSPLAISKLTSWTAFSSLYSVERKGCRTRSLSVEYCWWGSRNVLLTPCTEIAGASVGAQVVAGAESREIVVVKGLENATNRGPPQTRCNTYRSWFSMLRPGAYSRTRQRGDSCATIHSAETNAVPQSGSTTPQSPAAPNSAAYHQPRR